MCPTDPFAGSPPLNEAEAYDAWYETTKGKAILATEVGALRPLIEAFPQPRVEVGVGTGRFAEAIGVGFGLDPSHEALRLARRRGILAVVGSGEAVPFAGGRFGTVLIAFTLCFLVDPAATLLEARRLLVGGGGLAVGFVPARHPGPTCTRFVADRDIPSTATPASTPWLRSSSFLRSPVCGS